MSRRQTTLLKDDEEEGKILFYRASGKYGFLSCLYYQKKKKINKKWMVVKDYKFFFENRLFDSREEAYQFGKFLNEVEREGCTRLPYPRNVAQFAHSLFRFQVVPNWSKIKVNRMYRVLTTFFNYHDDMKEKLLETGDNILIENSVDSFWGNGKGKKKGGKNMLGKLLMIVRAEIGGKPIPQDLHGLYESDCERKGEN